MNDEGPLLARPGGTTPGSVLVVVPTTGGPLLLRSLRLRPGLPASAAFADGDYRPLPWAADYARLAALGGPLSRIEGRQAGPYELRLSGSFDAGRSWEVPVSLAHGLLAQGRQLTADPARADLILWATGAVDLDLAILPGDYALVDKIERSQALLDAAPNADLAILLPEGPEREQAERVIRGFERERPPILLPAHTVPAALEALADAAGSRAGPSRSRAPAVPAWAKRLALPAAALAGLAGITVAVALHEAPPGRTTQVSEERPAVEPAASPTVRPAASSEPADPASSTNAAREAARPADPVLVEELLAPAGSSCRRVAFGAEPAERRAVPLDDGGSLRASRLAPGLCGIAVRSGTPGTRIAVGPELRAAALPPKRLPDGAEAYFLRENARRNLVYSVQGIPEAGPASPPITHALAP